MNTKNIKQEEYQETIRRLSPWRVLLAIVFLAGFFYTAVIGWGWWQEERSVLAYQPWFGSYVDVTSTPQYPFEQLSENGTKNAVLSFIVSSKTDPCTPTWGGVFTMDEARASLDLDRRIARLKQQEGSIAISFGGLINDELALNCRDHTKLSEAYKAVIDRYDVDTIDLDLENDGLTNREAGIRRSQVIAGLQKTYREQGKNLAVWITLPVAPQGLTKDGTDAIALLLANNVDITGVNVMTMNYATSRQKNESMADASKKALIETHRQLDVLYQQAGLELNNSTLWSKIGATPMIGQNDVVEEIFTIHDAEELNSFASAKGIGRMSMWSANRDVPCGENYVDVRVVSDSCSGLKDKKFSFAKALGLGFEGSIMNNIAVMVTESPLQKTDDPEKSPYPIWNEDAAYLEGTKVVWHRNVYEAKWWTQGDTPDNPVLQAWETPWQLIGPVLPGEKPIPQPTLPEGTYPEWEGSKEYETGQRVLYKGLPYQAKWWTQGDSPAGSTANADNSPWVPLTQQQIKKILENAGDAS